MIKNSEQLIKNLNKFIQNYPRTSILVNGVRINVSKREGNYYECKIGGRSYLLLLEEKRRNTSGKCFIHLYDGKKDKPSVLQFTIDNSNFRIENNQFYLIQNRGTTIGKRIAGFETEFKALMEKNGFNVENIVATGSCIKPDYIEIIGQISLWIKIRVKTKLELEEKYRNIENRSTEDESEENLDGVGDIENKTEGGKKVVISVRTERNPKLRLEAIKIHGLKCKGCDFDFEKRYGTWGKSFIEVHHAVPLGNGIKRDTNPKTDLIVVCSNCHRMIHRKKGITLTIDELRNKIAF